MRGSPSASRLRGGRLRNFLLQFCPTVAQETALRQRFAEIDIGAGKRFDFEKLLLEDKAAVGFGIKDGFEKIKTKREALGKDINGWRVGSVFGDRAFYHNDWLLRAAAARDAVAPGLVDPAAPRVWVQRRFP